MKVLVTGGTRGIGREIAAQFLAIGSEVVICGRQPPADPLPGATFMPCDVAVPDAVDTLFQAIGTLDVLVNNAGKAGADRPDDDDESHWRSIMAINLDGAYRCAKAAIPRMPDRTGRIINIASILGLRAVPDQVAYCAAKHGVVGLTRALSLALAPRGITVNAICPGWVDTEMSRGRFVELGLTADEVAQSVPTGKITTPRDIATMVTWLASPDAGNLTGQAIVIDGGLSV
ncbi:MAG: SDR family NAD(P)-dependent oxidoreductase [Limnothrix sp. BL-A-16]|jgi:NAD(P)-dependent dehydrogenase (short-subunit alcohol dehydrogenase family)